MPILKNKLNQLDNSVDFSSCTQNCDDILNNAKIIQSISSSIGDSNDCTITITDPKTKLSACPETTFGKINNLINISAKESSLGHSIYGLEKIKNAIDSKPSISSIEGSTIIAKKSDLTGLVTLDDINGITKDLITQDDLLGLASSDQINIVLEKIGMTNDSIGNNTLFELVNLLKEALTSEISQFGSETIYGKIININLEIDKIQNITDSLDKIINSIGTIDKNFSEESKESIIDFNNEKNIDVNFGSSFTDNLSCTSFNPLNPCFLEVMERMLMGLFNYNCNRDGCTYFSPKTKMTGRLHDIYMHGLNPDNYKDIASCKDFYNSIITGE